MVKYFKNEDDAKKYIENDLHGDVVSMYHEEVRFDYEYSEDWNWSIWLNVKITHEKEVHIHLSTIYDFNGDIPDQETYKHEIDISVIELYCSIPQEWYENFISSDKEELSAEFSLTSEDWSDFNELWAKLSDDKRSEINQAVGELYLEHNEIEVPCWDDVLSKI